ncbi:uncharacterized protein LOC136744560 [Amia ocellicauda]|uniref:uncharacterized protein LOC136744560 n=1 Tax=Amia ocellicauda TaxID=2972642 RepID=UPI003464BAC7
MKATPQFRCKPSSRELVLQATAEAKSVASATKSSSDPFVPLTPREVRKDAVARILSQGGDPGNTKLVLSQSTLQFGRYRGQTFKWILENDGGYAVSLVAAHQKEREMDTSDTVYMANKDALASYACGFPKVAIAVGDRRARNATRAMVSQSGREDQQVVGFGAHKGQTWQELYEAIDKERRGESQAQKPAAQPASSQPTPSVPAPCQPPRTSASQSAPTLSSSATKSRAPVSKAVSRKERPSLAFSNDALTDAELLAAVEDMAPPPVVGEPQVLKRGESAPVSFPIKT